MPMFHRFDKYNPAKRLALAVSVLLLPLAAFSSPQPASALACTFKNPLLAQGQDPSVVYHDGYYYLVQSNGGHLTIQKSAALTQIGDAPVVPVFTPKPDMPYSEDMWAPELALLGGKWYIYFAADNPLGNNAAHRMYVLQADTADPQGSWTLKGRVYNVDPATDKWAIDGTVFVWKGVLYMVWAGWPGDKGDFPQNLYIAPMSDPLTISAPRSLIAQPDQPWERSVAAIMEGPEPFIHNDQLSIVYSADASWSAAYKLGMLRLIGGDPLKADSWVKSGPIFQRYSDATGDVYGPGHNSPPVPSPDGKEDWLVYHAKAKATDGWQDRDIRAQPFTWNADDTPNLGHPIPASQALPVPSGQPCGTTERWLLDEGQGTTVAGDKGHSGTFSGTPTWTTGQRGKALHFNGQDSFVDLNAGLVDMRGSFTVAAWVQLDRADGDFSAVSQDGGVTSGFALRYSATQDHRFAFSLFDWQGKNDGHATSTFQPSPGEWYHLIGVNDGSSGQIKLYVNGKLENTLAYQSTWLAKGHTIIGAGRRRVQRAEYFAGAIDEVQIMSGALNDQEVAALYQAGSAGQ